MHWFLRSEREVTSAKFSKSDPHACVTRVPAERPLHRILLTILSRDQERRGWSQEVRYQSAFKFKVNWNKWSKEILAFFSGSQSLFSVHFTRIQLFPSSRTFVLSFLLLLYMLLPFLFTSLHAVAIMLHWFYRNNAVMISVWILVKVCGVGMSGRESSTSV